MIAKDKEIIDRAFRVAVVRQHEELTRNVRQLVNDAAGKGRLGLGPFHSQIADLFISAYRERGETLWSLTSRILSTGGSEAQPTVPDEIKQFLQERLATQWQELENELDKALKTMNAMPGLLGRLGEAHQHLRDDLFVRVDLAVREVSERAASETRDTKSNADSALRDGLTSLLRREALDAALPICLDDANASGRPFSLVMVDIDHFKAVNDVHGHPMGDEVLKKVAECVIACVSGKGDAYRYGGEEFMLVLRNHDAQEATAVAERVRGTVQASRPGGLEITASLGVASLPAHASSVADLIRLADAAMYDAKHRGRNLVRVHGDGEPPASAEWTPARRQPVPGGLSQDEGLALRKAYFTSRVIQCARDGARLDVHEFAEMGAGGAAAVHLLIWCKLCGLQQEI